MEFEDPSVQREVVESGERTLLELVGAVADEDVVAVHDFFPGRRWKRQDPLHVERLARKVAGRGRLEDRLPFLCVLALTHTRILVYGTTIRNRKLTLTKKFFDWQRSQVTSTRENVSFVIQGGMRNSAAPFHAHVVRLTLQTPDGGFLADLEAKGTLMKETSERFASRLAGST